MAVSRSKSLSTDSARKRLAALAEEVARADAAGTAEDAARSAVRQAAEAEAGTAPPKEKPKGGGNRKPAAAEQSAPAKQKRKSKKKDVADGEGVRIENDKALTSDPPEIYGPPVGDLIVQGRPPFQAPNMDRDAAEKLRKLMSTGRADAAREAEAAAKAAASQARNQRRADNYGSLVSRLRDSNARLRNPPPTPPEPPKEVYGPPVGDLVTQGRKPQTPPSERTFKLPKQHALIRRLVGGGIKRGAGFLEDAAILGGTAFGFGAAGGVRGIGNFLANGFSGRQPPSQPPASGGTQGNDGQEQPSSYGAKFRKAAQSRQPANNSGSTFRRINRGNT